MANLVVDYARGRWAEKAADDATKFGIVLLKVAEADATLRTRQTIAAVLAAANTEANFTNYARITGITATLAVDTSGHKATIDLPDDTTAWGSAGGAVNNNLVKLLVYYEDSAADSGRKLIYIGDFVISTNGADLGYQFPDGYLCSA